MPEFLEVIASDGCPTHLFLSSGAYDRAAIGRVREYLQSEKTQILCTHDYRTHLIGYLASRGLPVKWIAFSRGWTQDNVKVRLYHWIEKILIRFADKVVAVSESQKRRLVRHLVPEHKISVVLNAIDTTALKQVVAENLRKRFEFPKESIVAVAAGRFSREKGQANLVEAGALAIRRRPLLRIVVFGNGPDNERIKQLILENSCSDQIRCPGFERNVLGSIKGADMLVNPSLSEGLPNIVLEGMALGTPVIATRVGGVPELIIDNVSGIMVPAESPVQLADALVRLVDQPALRQQLANVALDKVREEFSFEGQMTSLSAIYNEVMR
jgi:glycosyltransferase involved in cell wall biosynthesis